MFRTIEKSFYMSRDPIYEKDFMVYIEVGSEHSKSRKDNTVSVTHIVLDLAYSETTVVAGLSRVPF